MKSTLSPSCKQIYLALGFAAAAIVLVATICAAIMVASAFIWLDSLLPCPATSTTSMPAMPHGRGEAQGMMPQEELPHRALSLTTAGLQTHSGASCLPNVDGGCVGVDVRPQKIRCVDLRRWDDGRAPATDGTWRRARWVLQSNVITFRMLQLRIPGQSLRLNCGVGRRDRM